jgi:CopG antitoxin of type II toxin-antitoxin system
MARRAMEIPKFKTESDEAEWWASAAGRSYVKRKSGALHAKGVKMSGSPLVAQLSRKRKSTQIAIRLPEADIAQARKIAERKGVGYQTLLKMLVHEGLLREGRRG